MPLGMGSCSPSLRGLRVFEKAARHESFTRTARELNLSQSSVSRHIADLEQHLSVTLFKRELRRVRLTEAGEILHRAIAASLASIDVGVAALLKQPSDERIVIASGHGASQLFLMPRFETLRRALGGEVNVSILTCDYDMLGRLEASRADVVLSYSDAGSAPEDRRVVMRPAMGPVCSPEFAAAHADTLGRPVEEWGGMPFLSYARPSRGWATWSDWFDVAGYPEPPPKYVNYNDYVYLFDAALNGRGLALAWDAFIERSLDAGTLVAAAGGFVEFDCPLYLRLTERGRSNPAARRCLELFPPAPRLQAARPRDSA